VSLALRKSVGASAGGAEVSGMVFLRFDFKLVAVKTISWSHDDESPKETVTFEYGGLQIRYAQQEASGKLMTAMKGGWNRVKNIKVQTADKIG
jgi:type VI protein secretion system component Hcp